MALPKQRRWRGSTEKQTRRLGPQPSEDGLPGTRREGDRAPGKTQPHTYARRRGGEALYLRFPTLCFGGLPQVFDKAGVASEKQRQPRVKQSCLRPKPSYSGLLCYHASAFNECTTSFCLGRRRSAGYQRAPVHSNGKWRQDAGSAKGDKEEWHTSARNARPHSHSGHLLFPLVVRLLGWLSITFALSYSSPLSRSSLTRYLSRCFLVLVLGIGFTAARL